MSERHSLCKELCALMGWQGRERDLFNGKRIKIAELIELIVRIKGKRSRWAVPKVGTIGTYHPKHGESELFIVYKSIPNYLGIRMEIPDGNGLKRFKEISYRQKINKWVERGERHPMIRGAFEFHWDEVWDCVCGENKPCIIHGNPLRASIKIGANDG